MFARSCALALILVPACGVPPVDEEGSSSSSGGVVRTTGDGTGSSTGSEDGSSSTSSSGAEGTSGTSTGEVSASSSGSSGEADSSSGGEATSGSESSSTGADLCGNGELDPGEQCDFGMETKLCDGDCTVPICGDLFVNAAAGEACDDGNVDEEDGCLSNCKLPACGDGKPQAGEECDDGNDVDGDGCEADCTITPYTFIGVKSNVKVSALVGWNLCFEYSGIPDTDSLNSMFSKCKKPELLLACGDKNKPDTYIMAAHAKRSDLLQQADAADPQVLNGAQWANDFKHYGYSSVGVDMTNQGSYMFMWSMNEGFIKSARCGSSATEMQFKVYDQ